MSGDASLKSKLNIHGIIDLDQMATVLTSLIEQVDRQNRVIGDLQKSLSQYTTRQTFMERIGNLESLLSKAHTRIEALHEATTATVFNKKISAGNLATSNFKHITHLTELVHECATKLELDGTRKELAAARHDASVLRVDFEHSLAVVDQLSSAQLHQNNRTQTLESSVAGKIDRAECDHLQSLVSKVLLYDAFKSDTTQAMQELQHFRERSLQQYTQYEQQLSSLDAELQQAMLGLSRAATKKEAHALAKELQQHEQKLSQCATIADVQKIRDDLGAAGGGLQGANQRITALEGQAGELQQGLGTKASLADLRQCVTRTHYEQAVQALGAELENRAPQSSMHRLDHTVQVLDQRVQKESEKTALAIKFVDWFSSRGENYEHNMQIIDKHLKGLVVSPEGKSSSHVHSYFIPGNKVVFNPQQSHAP
ncbi:hypothetical protein B484DRAFT_444391 [Ochromonadaceae sp. CCMP2298]|nr:hypothetical protein B484DRAFT_444391 [Ochromonadaceae sp. CCMP2298]